MRGKASYRYESMDVENETEDMRTVPEEAGGRLADDCCLDLHHRWRKAHAHASIATG